MSYSSRRTYMSYHTFKDYKECPQRYHWRQILKKVSTVPDVPQYRILGIVWNDMLETFYKERKFLLRGGARDWMAEETKRCFGVLEKKLCVPWRPGERQEFLQDAVKFVDPIIETIKRERLLAPSMHVEVPMYVNVPRVGRLGGRPDLAYARESDHFIVDFKGTKHRNGKYLSEDQLRWYALLYKGHFHRLPTYLGFWLLRFDEIRWIDASVEALDAFLEEVKKVFGRVQEGDFGATPSHKACGWCLYRDQCPDYDKFLASRPKRKSKIDMSVDDGFGENVVIDV